MMRWLKYHDRAFEDWRLRYQLQIKSKTSRSTAPYLYQPMGAAITMVLPVYKNRASANGPGPRTPEEFDKEYKLALEEGRKGVRCHLGESFEVIASKTP